MQPSIIISKDMVNNADETLLQKIKLRKKHTFCLEIKKNNCQDLENFQDHKKSKKSYTDCAGYFLDVLSGHRHDRTRTDKNHQRLVIDQHHYLTDMALARRNDQNIIKCNRNYISQYFCNFKYKYLSMEKKIYNMNDFIKEKNNICPESLDFIMKLLNELNSDFFSIHKKFNQLKLINENNFIKVNLYKDNMKYEEFSQFMSTLLKIINTVSRFISEMKSCHFKMQSIHKKISDVTKNHAPSIIQSIRK